METLPREGAAFELVIIIRIKDHFILALPSLEQWCFIPLIIDYYALITDSDENCYSDSLTNESPKIRKKYSLFLDGKFQFPIFQEYSINL